ncbi:hypothetical protein J6590_097616 [Homalodisca vitripennis]|nr:hypothetical protein J6590_097616 [Homalodisca vitripennis]
MCVADDQSEVKQPPVRQKINFGSLLSDTGFNDSKPELIHMHHEELILNYEEMELQLYSGEPREGLAICGWWGADRPPLFTFHASWRGLYYVAI